MSEKYTLAERETEEICEKAKLAQIRYELRMEALKLMDDEIFPCSARIKLLGEIKQEIEDERRKVFIALELEAGGQEDFKF